MDWLHHLLWFHGKFLGTDWSWWKLVGLAGNLVFSSRVYVQWYAAERKRQVIVPVIFWWLSLCGSLILLAYTVFCLHDMVMILAYAFSWIPYIRNLMIHYRHHAALLECAGCGQKIPPQSNYCPNCGGKVNPAPASARA